MLCNAAGCHPALWLSWIARIDPGLQAAEQGRNIGVTLLNKIERRTGAGVFIGSGAIGDDPLVFIKTEFWINLKVANIDRVLDVFRLILLFAPRVDEESGFIIERAFGVFETDARDFVCGLWNSDLRLRRSCSTR